MCEDEYANISSGGSKIYIHEKHYITNSKGEKLLIRISFDNERCFIRSVNFVKRYVNEFKEIGTTYVPLRLILCETSHEKLGELCPTLQTN